MKPSVLFKVHTTVLVSQGKDSMMLLIEKQNPAEVVPPARTPNPKSARVFRLARLCDESVDGREVAEDEGGCC
jgi:hypothetical protein